MEEMTSAEILEILKLIADSNIEEINLEMGELKLLARKNPRDSFSSSSLVDDGRDSAQQSSIRTSENIQGMEKIISIKAPRLGNFWRAPKTGYAPFVEIGQRVVEDHVVCHIEVMGSFYPVKSGAKCRIAEILAENGQMVEFNQTLFLGTPE